VSRTRGVSCALPRRRDERRGFWVSLFAARSGTSYDGGAVGGRIDIFSDSRQGKDRIMALFAE
jgi:hypothetical protein